MSAATLWWIVATVLTGAELLTGTLYLLILRFAPWALHDALALWQQFSA